MNIKNKNELRKYFRNSRKNLEIEKISEKIYENLCKIPQYANAENVFTYYSVKDEIRTQRILNEKEKSVYIPKIIDGKMIAVKFEKEKIVTGAFGIPEPESAEEYILGNSDVVIVPALAANKNFYRLGYGGGFYDKYLKNSKGTKIVLIPQKHLISSVLEEPHDIRCDIIVTENEILINSKSLILKGLRENVEFL